MFVNVLFFQLEAEQRRHGVNVHAGRVFEQRPIWSLRAPTGMPIGQARLHSPQPVQRPARCIAWMSWKNIFCVGLSSCVSQCGSRLSATQLSRHTHMGQALRQA